MRSDVNAASVFQDWHGKHAIAFDQGLNELQVWQMSAHILTSVAVLQLKELNISNNKLTGTLPSSWSSLKQVRLLYTLIFLVHCLTTDCITDFKFAVIHL